MPEVLPVRSSLADRLREIKVRIGHNYNGTATNWSIADLIWLVEQVGALEARRAEQHSRACDLTSDNMFLRKKLDAGNRSLEDYIFQVSSQVVTQVLEIMESERIARSKFAKRLGVTKGRVSQILNHPGNLSLESIVRCARRLNRKVAIVLYDDGDPRNKKGSVLPQIFEASWKQSGEPRNFLELNDPRETRNLVRDASIPTSSGSEAERAFLKDVPSGGSRPQPIATQEVDALHALKEAQSRDEPRSASGQCVIGTLYDPIMRAWHWTIEDGVAVVGRSELLFATADEAQAAAPPLASSERPRTGRDDVSSGAQPQTSDSKTKVGSGEGSPA